MHSVTQPRQHQQRADDVGQQDNSIALALLTLQGACSAILLVVGLDTQGTNWAIVAVRAELA